MKTIKELEKVYYDTQGQSRELFHQQILYFRGIMCSKDKTFEEKQDAFGDLTQSYMRCELIDSDKALFLSTYQEFQTRLKYEVLII